jgi:polyisoprenoid-binding protein YceI
MSWNIDSTHSEILFSARHLMISKVRGQFEKFSGTINFNEQDPAQTTVAIQIEAASLNTREPQRDAHLRSADFLMADQFPYLTFQSKRVEMLSANRARLVGDLTIRDLSREVALDVEYVGKSTSPWGAVTAGFSAATRISRKEWGLTWNVALETGGVLVSDEIEIQIELELVQQPETAAQSAA